MKEKFEKMELAIIGSGPAGMSAAVYSARAGIKTVFFGDPKLGNLYKSHVISNYLCFIDNPQGPVLSDLGIKHAKKFGAVHKKNEIVSISYKDKENEFLLKDNVGNFYSSRALIIATGQSYVMSGIQNEQKLTGKGVSWCVTCDGFFFKNKKTIVIGNSDFAAEEALELTSYTNKIEIVTHGKKPSFTKEMEKKLKENNINIIETERVKEFLGEEKVIGIKFVGGKIMSCDGVFLALGSAGAGIFAKMLGIQTEKGYIETDKDGKTSFKGVFAAGDCTGSPPQVAASVGSGCVSALSAIKFLKNLNIYIQYN